MTPVSAYDPQFFFQKLLDIYKDGCLQKTRPQNIYIWPNDGHFMMKKKNFGQDFQHFYLFTFTVLR